MKNKKKKQERKRKATKKVKLAPNTKLVRF